jgi:hypothetical protein
MASPKEIPSKVNSAIGLITAAVGKSLHIVGLLGAGALTVDGVSYGTTGPASLFSPIKCNSCTTTHTGQIAYYEQ